MALAAVPVQIQGLLGASARTPYLATVVNAERPDQIDFMFGMACLASYRRDDLGTRNALIGMLLSAGVRLSDVSRVFQVDPRQARRYHRRYEEEGLAALAGAERGRPEKVTREVEAFVRVEFRELYQTKRRGYREELRRRVKTQFGVTLGNERLRQLTKPVREEMRGRGPEGRTHSPTERALSSVEEAGEGTGTGAGEGSFQAGGPERAGSSDLGAAALRRGVYTRYAGSLLLNVFLRELLAGTAAAVARGSERLYLCFSWMVLHMIQFGCVNLERAKGLVRREFGVLLGLKESPDLKTLRRWLAKLADTLDAGRLQAKLAANYLAKMPMERELFYLDGHFGPYTGQAPFLGGYHVQAHFWKPGRNHFLLSDRRGLPLLFELGDPSEDFRSVIPSLIRRTQRLVGGTEKLCFVFDRGGYRWDLFESFDHELKAHYITWEKYDATDYGAYDLPWHEFTVEMQGNTENQPKRKKLWVADCPRSVAVSAWGPKSPIRHHRKILVRRELRGRGGVVKGYQISPFLSNDGERTNEELARRLVGRWLQENGIKVQCYDFGLDEITSYLTVPYGSELAEVDPEHFAKVAAREIDNPRRKKLDDQCGKLRKQVKSLQERQTRIRGQGRSVGHKRLRKVDEELQHVVLSLQEAEAKREQEPKRINQLQYLMEEGYERPVFSRKLLMDILKLCACNARAQAAEALKPYYTNRRDHIILLRRMLQAGGTVKLRANGERHVRLEPLNTDAENAVFANFLQDINRREPQTFAPQTRPIFFELATRE